MLIFGKLGCPALGIEGAAIATVISRFVEAGILVIWTHLNTKKVPYIKGLYRSLHISGKLLKAIAAKGFPLLLNETMWSFGMAFLNQCYSVWGQDVNAAMGICSTLFNLAAVSFKALGSTVGILTGQLLGADVPAKDVRKANDRMTYLCLGVGAVFGLFMAAANRLFPQFYQTTDSVRAIASGLILIASCDVLLQAYIYPVYFTLRAGGKTMITFFFDCGAIWILSLPLAYFLSRYSELHVFVIYAIVTGVDLIKCIIGIFMLRSDTWMQKLTVQ
jgi:Na+-driven multidrug efflux pump